ncbi:unnamed protein product [Trifolium pratense]|uniref:Uncharacterized protein n=1 Tax=Trifolium pratense TaxID=57577 RepID=A0ACB0M8A4_TRIPR|nr:unnamed protein product [Trifolium pratense]
MAETSSSTNQPPSKRARKSVTNLRRSSRLMMQSSNTATKRMAEAASNNQRPSKRAKTSEKKSEKKQHFSCGDRKNIGRLGVYIKFNVDELAPQLAHVVNGCAILAMQDYAIQNSQNWRDWRLLKIVEVARVMVSGFRYYITFEAKDVRGVHHTFQADVWDSIRLGRRTNGFRTLKPRSSKWYSGNLWIPLTRSTSYIYPPCPDVQAYLKAVGPGVIFPPGFPEPQYNLLYPPKIMGEDCRNTYDPKWAKKSDKRAKKILAPGSEPVNLELDKLSDKDTNILKDCATLAMHDHLIQTLNMDWLDWELIKIVTANRRDSVSGSIYNLNFQIGYADSARTLEAEVFDGKDQRWVIGLKAIKPHLTDMYPGILLIPI